MRVSTPEAGPRTCREQRIVGDGLVPSRCRMNRTSLMRATARVAPTDVFHASFDPGAGPRICREQRIVGDGLVPSRCRMNRTSLMRATARVAPTDVFHASFDPGGGAADMQGTANRRGRACPVPLPDEPHVPDAGDRKGRPYGCVPWALSYAYARRLTTRIYRFGRQDEVLLSAALGPLFVGIVDHPATVASEEELWTKRASA